MISLSATMRSPERTSTETASPSRRTLTGDTAVSDEWIAHLSSAPRDIALNQRPWSRPVGGDALTLELGRPGLPLRRVLGPLQDLLWVATEIHLAQSEVGGLGAGEGLKGPTPKAPHGLTLNLDDVQRLPGVLAEIGPRLGACDARAYDDDFHSKTSRLAAS